MVIMPSTTNKGDDIRIGAAIFLAQEPHKPESRYNAIKNFRQAMNDLTMIRFWTGFRQESLKVRRAKINLPLIRGTAVNKFLNYLLLHVNSILPGQQSHCPRKFWRICELDS